jgi:hypothetical protein
MSARRRTPLVCPICGKDLADVRITPLGQVTAGLQWEMHAGRCTEHGWFQTEMISKPPREIFPVSRPGGVARKMSIGGRPVYSFPTVWDSIGGRRPVDPYDPEMWAVDWERLPGREDIALSST